MIYDCDMSKVTNFLSTSRDNFMILAFFKKGEPIITKPLTKIRNLRIVIQIYKFIRIAYKRGYVLLIENH